MQHLHRRSRYRTVDAAVVQYSSLVVQEIHYMRSRMQLVQQAVDAVHLIAAKTAYHNLQVDVGDGGGQLTDFMTLLALCHTVIPERPNDTDEVSDRLYLGWAVLI